jgi:hypothetical protein
MMASTTVKAARPMVRANVQTQVSQRAFSGKQWPVPPSRTTLDTREKLLQSKLCTSETIADAN